MSGLSEVSLRVFVAWFFASAAPVPKPAPSRAGTGTSRIAAVAIALGDRTLHSSRGGHSSRRKKIFSDYPRRLRNCLFLRRLLPVSDALAVTAALPVPFFSPLPCGSVSLLRFPARPFPRRHPALLAAIALTSLPGMKTFLASFEQTPSRPRTARRSLPPGALLIFGMACRILGRAHGR